jgi:hypothetical protein
VAGEYYRGTGFMRHLNPSLSALPGLLGEQRYAELTARGEAMDHDEISRFAQSEVDHLLATQT